VLGPVTTETLVLGPVTMETLVLGPVTMETLVIDPVTMETLVLVLSPSLCCPVCEESGSYHLLSMGVLPHRDPDGPF